MRSTIKTIEDACPRSLKSLIASPLFYVWWFFPVVILIDDSLKLRTQIIAGWYWRLTCHPIFVSIFVCKGIRAKIIQRFIERCKNVLFSQKIPTVGNSSDGLQATNGWPKGAFLSITPPPGQLSLLYAFSFAPFGQVPLDKLCGWVGGWV